MKKMLWILNPHAGRGAMSGKIIGCVNAFQQAGYEVTLYVTQGAQDATRMVRERAGEFDRIVCAGGDGTLNEVVTGLMESEVRPPLGYIPAGTTNDFALSLTIVTSTILPRSVCLPKYPMQRRSNPRIFLAARPIFWKV